MSFTNLLNKSIDIYRSTTTRTAMGGTETTAAKHLSGVPMRIRPLTGREREIGGTTGVVATHAAYCQSNLDILETDTLIDGTTAYDITLIETESSGQITKLYLQTISMPSLAEAEEDPGD